jgi:hypothetical protein
MRQLILVLLTVIAALPAAPAAAQSDRRCFPETGFCISGAIRAYWERNGGLPIFGYPIGDVAVESVLNDDNSVAWTGPVQWFERDRLEDHSAEGLGVLAGRLGAEQLRDFTQALLVDRPQKVGPQRGCRFFPETGFNLCSPYREYWEGNGGLQRFGYPLSEPFGLTVGAWGGQVQYFERRRMEFHNELPGSPILLGLLSREQRERVPSAVCDTPIDPAFAGRSFDAYRLAIHLAGCPLAPQRDLPLAEQQFERGVMLYAATGRTRLGNGQIFMVRTTPLPVVYIAYPNTWAEGQPDSAGLTPPAGLQEPRRGFGKLWRETPGVRETLGWALAPERADRGVFQPLSQGGGLLYAEGTNMIYLFGPNGLVWAFGRY